jgi:uncharacterized membrane protein YqaE (UPF0057 family)
MARRGGGDAVAAGATDPRSETGHRGMTGAIIDWRCDDMCVLQAIVAVLLPPLAVLWKRGLGSSFVLSIILTILGYVPGLIYALYVVITDRD